MPFPLALPLAVPFAVKIALGIATALGLGGAAYFALSRKDKIIFLDGDEEVGKTTMLQVLQGEYGKIIHQAKPKQTTKNRENALEMKIKGRKYGFIDTSGASYNKGSNEELKNKLQKEQKGKVLEFYVFKASDFDSKNLINKIKARKKEAELRGFECVAIGTHKDEISADKKEAIEKEVKALMHCQIFQLTNNAEARKELETFISEVS